MSEKSYKYQDDAGVVLDCGKQFHLLISSSDFCLAVRIFPARAEARRAGKATGFIFYRLFALNCSILALKNLLSG